MTDIQRAQKLYMDFGAPPPIYKQGVVDSGAFEIDNENEWILKHEEHGILIGIARLNPETFAVSELVVHPDYRRSGYGNALLYACYEKAGAKLNLCVIHDNTVAIALYDSIPYLTKSKVTDHVSRRDGRKYQLYHYNA